MEGVRWLLLLAAAAVAGAGAQCLSADDGPGGGAGAEAEVAALRAARADFALALLREAATGPGGAPLVSPASAFDALLLALAGAANRTEEALRATLRLPAQLSKAAALRALRSEALLRAAEAHALQLDRSREEEEEDGEDEVQEAPKPIDAPEREGLRTANRVFVAENVTLRECVKELLGADQESLAVAADPEAAAARVNAWVAEQTAGRIKQLVPALRPDAQLVLVNAAFFRGAWASRFPRNRSALAVFHSAPDRRALVPMMRQKGSFNYVVSERLGAHALELPFARGGFSLLLLLPPFSSAAGAGAGAGAEGRSAEGGAGGVELGVDALLRRLDAPALAELLRDLDGAAQTVEVHVPRLALDADIDLVPVLERMGAGDAFQPSADYSGFTGSRGPSFDGARQRARLDADEEGATAAAATALFLFRSARPAEPARFVANHPGTMALKIFVFSFLCLALLESGFGRIHKLEMKNEGRRFISLSTFGFFQGGLLDVNLTNFHAKPFNEKAVFGFSLDRTLSDAMNPYLDSHQDGCLLQQPPNLEPSGAVAYFTLDLQNKLLRVNCSHELQSIHIYRSQNDIPLFRPKRANGISISHTNLFSQRRRRSTGTTSTQLTCSQQIRISSKVIEGVNYYNANFVMFVATEREEGLYNLYFHNCPNYEEKSKPVLLDFTISIEEKNGENYLSAGEMPLPALYFMMALLFFLSGCFWVFILRKSRHPVYKIHYLMAVLVYLKSLSLLFHGINYHFIQTKGEHVAAWAILYYVAHLLKGAVLFITIVLVGTGWTFIKHILSEKDKKIFMIVIPLQVLANVAEIIIEESEEGTVEHHTWRDVFILVDLICCGAILFPVVWSIRHLQEASHTDGKAAINLRKLKLFRHFYIMIVCYIYFTRIIVYLLKITVPFQYEWLDEMFREMATYVFFVLTGYKFRPASANPYFQVTTEDDDEDMDVVVSQSGLTEGLSKIARTTKVMVDEPSDEEKDNLLAKRESSHEYD